MPTAEEILAEYEEDTGAAGLSGAEAVLAEYDAPESTPNVGFFPSLAEGASRAAGGVAESFGAIPDVVTGTEDIPAADSVDPELNIFEGDRDLRDRFGNFIGEIGVGSAPFLAGAGAGGAAGFAVGGPPGALIGAGVGGGGAAAMQSLGGVYLEARRAGETHDDAVDAAMASAAASGIINGLSVPVAALRIFRGPISNFMAQVAVQSGIGVSDQAAQNVVAKETFDPQRELGEGLKEAALGEALFEGPAVVAGVRATQPTLAEQAGPAAVEGQVEGAEAVLTRGDTRTAPGTEQASIFGSPEGTTETDVSATAGLDALDLEESPEEQLAEALIPDETVDESFDRAMDEGDQEAIAGLEEEVGAEVDEASAQVFGPPRPGARGAVIDARTAPHPERDAADQARFEEEPDPDGGIRAITPLFGERSRRRGMTRKAKAKEDLAEVAGSLHRPREQRIKARIHKLTGKTRVRDIIEVDAVEAHKEVLKAAERAGRAGEAIGRREQRLREQARREFKRLHARIKKPSGKSVNLRQRTELDRIAEQYRTEASMKDMTLEEVRTVAERVNRLRREGRMITKLRRRQYQRDVARKADQVAQRVRQATAANPLARPSRFRAPAASLPDGNVRESRNIGMLESLAAFGEAPLFTFNRWDGFDMHGPWRTHFYDSATDGYVEYRNTKDFVDSAFSDAIETASGGDAAWLDRTLTRQQQVGKGPSLDGNTRIAIAMAMLDPNAKHKLVDRGFRTQDGKSFTNLTRQQLLDVANSLSADEQKLVKISRDLLDAMYDVVAEPFQRLNNEALPQIDGYWPNVGDAEADTAGVDSSFVSTVFAGDKSFAKEAMSKGMTKARKARGKQRLIMDWASVLANHVDKAAYYGAMAERITEMRDIANSPVLRDALEASQGVTPGQRTDAKKFLDRWIESVSRVGAAPPQNVGESMLRWLRTRPQPALLGWRVSTMLKQAVSTSTAVADYVANFGGSVHHINQGWAHAGLHPKGVREWAKNMFPELRHRSANIAIEDMKREAARRGQVLSGKDKSLLERSLRGIRFVDEMTVSALAWGIYHGQVRAGKSDAEARRVTMDVINRTQPTTANKDLAGVFTSGEFLRNYQSFTQQVNKNTNLDKETLAKLRTGEVSAGQVPGYILFRHIIPAGMMLATNKSLRIGALLAGGLFWSGMLRELAMQYTVGLPMVGPVISSALFRVFELERDPEMPGLSSLAPAEAVMRNVPKAARATAAGDTEKAVRAGVRAAMAAGAAAGIPTEGARPMLEGAIDVATGKATWYDPRTWLFTSFQRGSTEQPRRSVTTTAVP